MEPNTPPQQPQAPAPQPMPQPAPPQLQQSMTPPPPPVVMNSGPVAGTTPFEPARNGNNKMLLIILGVVVVVLLTAAAAYFWLVPMNQASSYKTKLQSAYSSQRAALQSAMDALTQKDVFAGTSINDESIDNQDLAATAKLIDAAQKQTTTLGQDAALPFWPGANVLGAGNDAVALQSKVSDYVTKSKAFLDDFQKLDKFIADFNDISVNEAPPAIAALNAIKGPGKDLLLAQTAAASKPLATLVNALRKVTPPDDLKNYTSSFIDDLSQSQTAVGDINQALQTDDTATLQRASLTLISSGANIALLNSANPLTPLQSKSSQLQQQLTAAKDASIAFH